LTGDRRGRRLLRAVAVLLTWTVVGAAVAMVWVSTGGHGQKVRAMSVLSGSMVPTLEVGDLVVTRVVRPAELSGGDLVTFRDPTRDRFVTHRVQSIVWRGELAEVVTRGDANEVGEEWTVSADGTVGLVVLRLPAAGYALGALGTTAGQLVVGVVALALAVWTIELIWRPDREPGVATSPPTHARAAEHSGRGGRAPQHRPVPEAAGRAR
jgi:signal peptidase